MIKPKFPFLPDCLSRLTPWGSAPESPNRVELTQEQIQLQVEVNLEAYLGCRVMAAGQYLTKKADRDDLYAVLVRSYDDYKDHLSEALRERVLAQLYTQEGGIRTRTSLENDTEE